MAKLIYTNSWPPHIIRSVLLGALIAGLCMAAYFTFDMIFVPHTRFVGEDDLSWGFGVFAVTFFLWAGGLTLLGVPAWCMLHRYGYRNWLTAAGLGFFLPFTVSWRGADTIDAIVGYPQRHGWAVNWLDVAYGAIGVIVGLVIFWTAYGRLKDDT